ncbi:hypothetical protein TPE_2087 [Treponema pedis str. T A4]|uniref:Uncharacterized protein n=1 Tax=Treponema pedis str. T A4 TaxID=1291379 RepID=S6A4M8_9SPIR|nr:hypothetical protein TPE_2087 [Treponema pedis str. T A4]
MFFIKNGFIIIFFSRRLFSKKDFCVILKKYIKHIMDTVKVPSPLQGVYNNYENVANVYAHFAGSSRRGCRGKP